MIKTIKSPSTWILSRARFALWLIVLLLFAALLLVPGADALGTNRSDVAAATPTGETATEGQAPPGQSTPAAEQASPPAEEAPPPVKETSPPAEAPLPAEAGPPAAEEAPPPVKEASPPAEEAPPPVKEASPPAEAPLPAEAGPPAAEEAPPPVKEASPPVREAAPPGNEGTLEQPSGKAPAEVSAEGRASEEAGRSPPVHAAASPATGEDAPAQILPGVAVAEPSSAAPGGPPAISPSPEQGQTPVAVWPNTVSVPCAQVSGELAGFLAPTAEDWLNLSGASPESATRLAAVGASPTAITGGAPADSDGSGPGSAVGSGPSAPTPGPAPGGSSGGSAAGSGSGSASATSFALVGFLLQAAPRAMMPLRLAQLSWRTSFFVLIPEQPD